MSDQNRKRRIRRRMQTTGQKYSAAARAQEARDTLPSSPRAPHLLAHLGREACDHCGGPIRWLSHQDLSTLDPVAHAEATATFGQTSWSAWMCLTCDSVGILSEPVADESFDELLSHLGLDDPSEPPVVCETCPVPLEWIDPASVAAFDRAAFIEGRRRYGLEAVLDGDATRCPQCCAVTFHPFTPH